MPKPKSSPPIVAAGARELPVKLGRQYRAMQVEGYDPQTRTVTMAISSGTPVERWYGTEVLSHEPSAIRTQRMAGGMPTLFNHDPDKHIGITTGYTLTDKLRTVNKLGDNPLALEKERDLASGILKDTSIGYIVHKYQITEDDKGNRTYLATDWEPLENSLVTIPADIAVGVGRGAPEEYPVECVFASRSADAAAADDEGDEDDPDGEDDPGEGSEPAPRSTPIQGARTMPEVIVDHAADNKKRIADLRALRTQYADYFSESDLLDAIGSDTTPGQAREAIADKIIASSQRSNVRTAGDQVMDQLSEREQNRYSVRRVLRHAINLKNPGTFRDDADAGFELEVSAAIRTMAQSLGVKGFGTGVLMPTNLPFSNGRALEAAQNLRNMVGPQMFQRLMTAGGSTTGAPSVFTTTETTAIELLRNRARVGALGAQMLSGLSGLLRLPRQTAASSSSWLAENSPVSNSDMNFDDVTLSPKRLSIQGSYTIELLAQTSLAIEDMLRMDQAAVLALSIDFAAIAGSGVAPVPLGLLNQSGLAAILTGTTRNQTTGAVTAGLGAVPHTWNDIIAYETAIAKANADTATMGWLFTPEVRGALKATAMFPSGLANPIWPTTANRDPNGIEEGPLGYKAGVTNQLPKNLSFNPGSGVVNNLHAAIFGDFASMLIADWGVKEVVVDNITQVNKGIYIITENSLHDTNVRHIEKFAASQCVLPS